MVSKALTTAFDYKAVKEETKGKLIYLAGQIKKEAASHTRTGIAIGESVAKAHALLAGDGRDGQFKGWVEAECGFSIRTAYNYMQAWQTFGESEAIEQYEPTAMYTLSGPKVPPAAVKEAEKLAKKGERITADLADEIVGKFRESKKTSAKQANGATSVQPLHTSLDEQPSEESDSPPVSAPTPATEVAVEDYGKCPNCAGTKWVDDEFGVSCSKCKHPHGAETGGVDDQRVKDARSKTIKTVEAAMRAFDDLNLLASHPHEHANAIATCKILLKTARDWA